MDVEELYTLIKELFLTLDEGDQFLFGRYNLSVTRFYALHHLNQTPGISLRELSQLMLCDKSNVTRFIQSLEADGLVERRRHESDGRSLRLYLTEEGQTLQTTVAAEHEAFNRIRFASSSIDFQDSNVIELLTDLKARLKMELEQIKSDTESHPTD